MVPLGNSFEFAAANFSAGVTSPQIAKAKAGRPRRRTVWQLPDNALQRQLSLCAYATPD
jgi:hypothetical protein